MRLSVKLWVTMAWATLGAMPTAWAADACAPVDPKKCEISGARCQSECLSKHEFRLLRVRMSQSVPTRFDVRAAGYDDSFRAAVANFQRDKNLSQQNGTINPETLRAAERAHPLPIMHASFRCKAIIYPEKCVLNGARCEEECSLKTEQIRELRGRLRLPPEPARLDDQMRGAIATFQRDKKLTQQMGNLNSETIRAIQAEAAEADAKDAAASAYPPR